MSKSYPARGVFYRFHFYFCTFWQWLVRGEKEKISIYFLCHAILRSRVSQGKHQHHDETILKVKKYCKRNGESFHFHLRCFLNEYKVKHKKVAQEIRWQGLEASLLMPTNFIKVISQLLWEPRKFDCRQYSITTTIDSHFNTHSTGT